MDIEAILGRIRDKGPTRVMVNETEAISPARAIREHDISPDIVFIRDDGWTLGAPTRLADAARSTWEQKWVAETHLPFREVLTVPRLRLLSKRARGGQERQSMEKYGWYMHFVQDDEDSPTGFNCHTHGLTATFGMPDVQIVIEMPMQTIESILHGLADKLKQGKKAELHVRDSDVLDGFDVMFVPARESGRVVWRMILPDKDNYLMKDSIAKPYDQQWSDLR